jgi:hypothetical protein
VVATFWASSALLEKEHNRLGHVGAFTRSWLRQTWNGIGYAMNYMSHGVYMSFLLEYHFIQRTSISMLIAAEVSEEAYVSKTQGSYTKEYSSFLIHISIRRVSSHSYIYRLLDH